MGLRESGLVLVLGCAVAVSGCKYSSCSAYPFGPRPSHRESIEKIERVYGTEFTYGNLLDYFQEGECLSPEKRCLNAKQAKKIRKYMRRWKFSEDDVLGDCEKIGSVVVARFIQRRLWGD